MVCVGDVDVQFRVLRQELDQPRNEQVDAKQRNQADGHLAHDGLLAHMLGGAVQYRESRADGTVIGGMGM